MSAFAQEPAEERAVFINQYAISSNIPAYIVEKDFWVFWLLGRIFATLGVGDKCVFKGGTSLSKVFGAIMRFSEDIDLAILPSALGWSEEDLDEGHTLPVLFSHEGDPLAPKRSIFPDFMPFRLCGACVPQ